MNPNHPHIPGAEVSYDQPRPTQGQDENEDESL